MEQGLARRVVGGSGRVPSVAVGARSAEPDLVAGPSATRTRTRSIWTTHNRGGAAPGGAPTPATHLVKAEEQVYERVGQAVGAPDVQVAVAERVAVQELGSGVGGARVAVNHQRQPLRPVLERREHLQHRRRARDLPTELAELR